MEITAAAATEQRRRVLEAVFGDSSDGEADAYPVPLSLSLGDRSHRWYPVHGVDGLWLCPDFLSAPQQASLLSAIQREGWFVGGSHNQAMRFGDLPDWATELTEFICEVACFGKVISLEGRELIGEDQSRKETCPMPLDLLWREPFFDQLIVNSYEPGNMCTCGLDAF